MKKIVLLLFITAGLYADGYTAGSFGYDWFNDDFKTSVLIGYEFRGLYFEGEQNTYMGKSKLYMFDPFEAEYYVRTGFVYKMVYLEYEHLCIHGIDQYNSPAGHGRVKIGFDTRLNDKNKDP